MIPLTKPCRSLAVFALSVMLPFCAAQAASVALRLGGDTSGLSDFKNNPTSFPVTKAGTVFMHFDGTPPLASDHLFDTSSAIIEIGMYTVGGAYYTGADVVSRIQSYENQGWTVNAVFLYREDWLNQTSGTLIGPYSNDWRILTPTDIANIRTALANSTLKCKNSVKLIQLLGSGSAWNENLGHAPNFPTFPPDELAYLNANFDGLGVECHVGDYDPNSFQDNAPRQGVLTAMAAIAKWTADRGKIGFVFMGGGPSTYTKLTPTQLTYEFLWTAMRNAGVDYRASNLIYLRQGARGGNMIPESAVDTLTHQQRWLINTFQAPTSLYVSEVADQTILSDTTARMIPFAIGEAELPTSALAVSATSSNQSLVSSAGLSILGRGPERLLAVTPNPSQTGTTTITLTVSDGLNVLSSSFQISVVPLSSTIASSSGQINDPATWGGSLPAPGDTGYWRSGSSSINMTGTSIDTFNGCFLEIQTGGNLAPGVTGASLTLNNLSLSGGTITLANNNAFKLDFNGQQFTLNGGNLKSGAGTTRSVKFTDGILAGSGTVNILGTDTGGSDVEFNAPVSTVGFSGVFNVTSNGILRLPPIPPENASFGINLADTGKFSNNTDVALTSLTINGQAIAAGVHTYASFTPGQQAFLVNNTGTITVIQTPTISPIADQPLALNSSTSPIPFTIGDSVADPSTLQISVISSNPGLVALSGIAIAGTGASRTVTVTPTAFQTGYSTIAITVSNGIQTASSTFTVTVDEVPFGRVAFFFNQPGNFEGWTAGTNGNLANLAVSGGALSGTIAAGDPQVSRSGLNFAGNSMPLVLVRMKSSVSGSAQLFWGNEVGGVSSTRSVRFPVAAGSTFNWYAVDLSANTNWAGHTINTLRLDPAGSSGTMAIDAILGSDGDFDKDGMQDAWEIANGLDPTLPADGLLDPDRDTISNAMEYTLGTSPAAANQPLALAPVVSGTNFAFSFVATQASGTGYTGRTRLYDVETTGTLANPASWGGLTNYTGIAGAGQTVTVTVPINPGPRFYRLKVRLQP